MSYSLNSLKGDSIGDYIGEYVRVLKGDSRSLDYSSCREELLSGTYQVQEVSNCESLTASDFQMR